MCFILEFVLDCLFVSILPDWGSAKDAAGDDQADD